MKFLFYIAKVYCRHKLINFYSFFLYFNIFLFIIENLWRETPETNKKEIDKKLKRTEHIWPEFYRAKRLDLDLSGLTIKINTQVS